VLLEREVRAFQPWPGSWFEAAAGRYTVWRAAVRADVDGAAPGALRAELGTLILQTARGALRLDEVQPAGGRRMTGEELLRGRPAIDGQHVERAADEAESGPIERPVGYLSVP
jgi:methionyl-tRNA formyltransferase